MSENNSRILFLFLVNFIKRVYSQTCIYYPNYPSITKYTTSCASYQYCCTNGTDNVYPTTTSKACCGNTPVWIVIVSALVGLICCAGLIAIIVVIVCYCTKRNNYMRNGQIISQSPGIAYSNQINRPPLPPNNSLIVNRWSTPNNPPQQTYNNLQSYPSVESNNSGFTQQRNNLPPPYQNQPNFSPVGQVNSQMGMINNGYS